MNRPAVWMLLAWVLALPARAADSENAVLRAVSEIDGAVASQARGVIAVNQAAGSANQQINAAAIAIGDQAVTAIQAGQRARNQIGERLGTAEVRIGQDAFANVVGVVSVNQASGIANAQSNSVAVAMGIKGEVGDEVLSTAFPDAAGLVRPGPAGGARTVGVDDTAFRNVRGLVQLNQTAGTGNSSANTFVLRVGAQPDL